jgi:uncharacterized membrane protein YccC
MASAFWQTVLRFDATKIAPEIAVRNTLGIVAPLVLGVVLGNPSAGVVGALGAVNVSYSDSRDPYATRARRMLMASLLVGIAVCAGALSAQTHLTAIVAGMLWAFGAGMMVVLGSRAGDLGSVTLVTFIIFAARSLTVTEAFQTGLLAFGGGLFQTLLSIAVWPVRPHGPERRIIAGLYRALAGIAVSPAGAAGAPPASRSISDAQEAMQWLGDEHSRQTEPLVFLLNQAERIRLTVLTIRRLARRIARDPMGAPPAEALRNVLTNSARALDSIAECAAAAETAGSLEYFTQSTATFRELAPASASTMFAAMLRDAVFQVDALAGQLRAAARLTGAQAPAPATADNPRQREDLFSDRARIMANLSLRSAAFRHALRLAVCVAVGDTLARIFGLERSYWLPMTMAIVLKPDFTGTFSRGILRVCGTLAGLAIATGLYHVLPYGPVSDIVLLTAFALVLRGVGAANYGIFVTAMSGVIVIFVAITGVSPKDAIVARAINTSLGGALALFAYWIWPTWERLQAGPVLADLLEASAKYFRAIAETGFRADVQPIDSIRMAARLARSNAEASVARLNSEPGTSTEMRTLLNEMLVSSHAIARAAMALESAGADTNLRLQGDAAESFAAGVESSLRTLSGCLRNGAKPPDDLPDLRAAWTAMQESVPQDLRYSLWMTETDRLTTALNTLREQAAKWNKTH